MRLNFACPATSICEATDSVAVGKAVAEFGGRQVVARLTCNLHTLPTYLPTYLHAVCPLPDTLLYQPIQVPTQISFFLKFLSFIRCLFYLLSFFIYFLVSVGLSFLSLYLGIWMCSSFIFIHWVDPFSLLSFLFSVCLSFHEVRPLSLSYFLFPFGRFTLKSCLESRKNRQNRFTQRSCRNGARTRCHKHILVECNQATLGRGGGQVVSVLAFYSDNPSLKPVEVYSFFCKLCV